MAPRHAEDGDITKVEPGTATGASNKKRKRKDNKECAPAADQASSAVKKTKRRRSSCANEIEAEPAADAGEIDDVPKKGKKRRWASAAEKSSDKDVEDVPTAGDTDAIKHSNSEVNIASKSQVFISGLPFDMDEEAVRNDFSGCGEIIELVMLKDKNTGQNRGLAFITFANDAAVQDALTYDGHTYGKRWINVKRAEPKGASKQPAATAGSDKKKSWSVGSKPDGCTCIVMKGLSYNATEDDLLSFFKDCGGGAEKIRLLKFKDTGKSRGMAFVDFESIEGVEAGMKLVGLELKGRKVLLDYARTTAETLV